jgi:DNA repair ATPase RecN
MPEQVDPIWYILDKIQKDIDRMDEKQDEHLVASTKLGSQVESVATKVTELNKLLTLDNGKPSIVSQLNQMSSQLGKTTSEVTETKALVSKLGTDVAAMQSHMGMKTPKEVSIERWKTIGKLGAAFFVVLPGILAFIHSFM